MSTLTKSESVPVPSSEWGRDHWSTLLFIEHLCVNEKGAMSQNSRARMRTNTSRHPGFGYLALPWRKKWATRMKGGKVPDKHHDDWDCALDLEAAGVVKNSGSAQNPVYMITDKGRKIVSALRDHKAKGGSLADFDYALPA